MQNSIDTPSETPLQTPAPLAKHDSPSLTWRLAQIVLVLAASYLYILFSSIGGILQSSRLMANPHVGLIIQTALLGIGIGLCIGFALKTFTSGQWTISLDWPTLIINLLAAGFFAVISFSFAIAVARNTGILTGPYRDATWLSPLLPFVWIGLTLSTIVKSRDR